MSLSVVSETKRLCSNCEHGYAGVQGVYCSLFLHAVLSDKVAEECEGFEAVELRLPGVTVTVDGVEYPSTVNTTETSATAGVPVETMTSEDLIAACERYLEARHITLWGEPFEIISPRGRRQAAVWLAEQVHGLSAIREAKQ